MIYATPYNEQTREPTAPSQPAGFNSLEELVDTMGEPLERFAPGVLAYGGGSERVLFTRTPWRVDP